MRQFFIIDFSVYNQSWNDNEILDKFSTDYKILLALDLNAWMSLINNYLYKMMFSLGIIKNSKSLYKSLVLGISLDHFARILAIHLTFTCCSIILD